jgi:hypothetical protein
MALVLEVSFKSHYVLLVFRISARQFLQDLDLLEASLLPAMMSALANVANNTR